MIVLIFFPLSSRVRYPTEPASAAESALRRRATRRVSSRIRSRSSVLSSRLLAHPAAAAFHLPPDETRMALPTHPQGRLVRGAPDQGPPPHLSPVVGGAREHRFGQPRDQIRAPVDHPAPLRPAAADLSELWAIALTAHPLQRARRQTHQRRRLPRRQEDGLVPSRSLPVRGAPSSSCWLFSRAMTSHASNIARSSRALPPARILQFALKHLFPCPSAGA